ncbi:MAG: 50S ribosomal protein L11 methyltransferase [Acidimicrobiales bacterium]
MLPPGLAVTVSPEGLAQAWPHLCPLQPVRREDDVVVCAPRCAPEAATAALVSLPYPVEALAQIPGWPDPAAAMLAGWYRRSPAHLAAPAGVRELVQAPGEGFGPGDHPTTAMCLAALEGLGPGPALDAGCGSGLLAQAWAALGRGPVVALDVDPRAVDHARRSLAAAGRTDAVEVRRGPIQSLVGGDTAGRTLLANVPVEAHRALLARVADPPAAVVLSGIRPAAAAGLREAWRARGMHPHGEWERGGFVCLRMVGG